MSSLADKGLKVVRAVAGESSGLERMLRNGARRMRVRRDRLAIGQNHVVFWEGDRDRRHIGMFMMGGCDLPSIFKAVPLIRRDLEGTCALINSGNIAAGRSDLILQSLDRPDENVVAEVIEKLGLRTDYFDSPLFEPTFRIPEPGLEKVDFPKNVVVLSIAADAVRTVYRHKTHGYLVDPGGWWLDGSKKQMLENLDVVGWFREHFESLGRVTPELFYENYSTFLPILKERTGAEVLVFNVLTVEPANPTHNYQLIRNAHTRHRREMNLALFELAREHDLSVIDIDRVLKDVGIRDSQVDFAHYPPECYEPIAREVYRVLKDRSIV